MTCLASPPPAAENPRWALAHSIPGVALLQGKPKSDGIDRDSVTDSAYPRSGEYRI